MHPAPGYPSYGFDIATREDTSFKANSYAASKIEAARRRGKASYCGRGNVQRNIGRDGS